MFPSRLDIIILVIALLKKELNFDDILDRMPVGQINNVGYV